LVPANSQILRCNSPAENAALSTVPKARSHLKAPVTRDPVELLLVAIIGAPCV